jgi:prepilin-type processing-associated H-X9-DG protein
MLFDGYQIMQGAMQPQFVVTNGDPFSNWQNTVVNTGAIHTSYHQYGLYMRHNKAPNYLFSDWHAERNEELHKKGTATPGNPWFIDPKLFTPVREMTSGD